MRKFIKDLREDLDWALLAIKKLQAGKPKYNVGDSVLFMDKVHKVASAQWSNKVGLNATYWGTGFVYELVQNDPVYIRRDVYEPNILPLPQKSKKPISNLNELKDRFAVECTTIDKDGYTSIKGTPADMINWIAQNFELE